MRTFCEQGGEEEFFRCGRPHFLNQKLRIFEIFGVSAQTGVEGVEPVRTFFGQGGGGSIFS